MAFLTAQQCCLYIIDPQERLMAHIHQADRVVANTVLMIRLARVLSIPILANTQYKKGIGPIVPELADLLSDVVCPDKVEFNGLANREVQAALNGLPATVDTLLLCGVETHICVDQTGRAALEAGYQVQVVAGAVSSRTPDNHGHGLRRLGECGAVVAPAEMIVYELLGRAGTDAFKAMLPYLK